MRQCFLCGANGTRDPLDRHHIFGGAMRSKSQRYGLVIDLCHSKCHIFGPHAVHRDPETRQRVQEWGQRKVMREQGWSIEEFRWEFGRNYLDEEPEEEPEEESWFRLDEEAM